MATGGIVWAENVWADCWTDCWRDSAGGGVDLSLLRGLAGVQPGRYEDPAKVPEVAKPKRRKRPARIEPIPELPEKVAVRDERGLLALLLLN